MKKEKGFSLLELVLVVAILMIISLIAILGYNKAHEYISEKTEISRLKAVHIAQKRYYLYNDQYANLDTLIRESYLENAIKYGKLTLRVNVDNENYNAFLLKDNIVLYCINGTDGLIRKIERNINSCMGGTVVEF
ncbi:MAG: prepilin-type N-terminal cleavage/methylation domain-containing protein, partial [Candidatus Dojkabacteria bacterium]|nr:prepilin-type N-terminal cleavage/methylation domain-containing protein [Candidatus Dojkabacteria bacterium]